MKKHFLYIIIYLSVIHCYSQPLHQWSKSIPTTGSASSDARSIVADAAGNVYVAGNFYGTCDFDPGPGFLSLTAVGITEDIYFAKYDPNGNLIYAKQINGNGSTLSTCKKIALDATGNIYIAGKIDGVNDFDPGPGTYTLNGGPYGYIAKYDNAGNFLWANPMGKGAFGGEALSFALFSNGDVWVTGHFSGNGDFDPGPGTFNLLAFGPSSLFAAKYDVNGNFIQAFRGAADRGNDMVIDASQNIYLTGVFTGTVDFDPGAGVTNLIAGSQDIFLAKYTNAGALIWARSFTGNSGAGGNELCLGMDASGDLYLTGDYSGTVDFDPNAGTANLTAILSTSDMFISKYDANGNYIFAKSIGSNGYEYQQGLFVMPSGIFFITGKFGAPLDFDPGANVATINPGSAATIFFAKYDAYGNYMWAVPFGSSAIDEGHEVFSDGTYTYLSGQFKSTIDFDPGIGVANLTSTNSGAFFAKYDVGCLSSVSQPTLINGLTSMCAGVGSTSYSINPSVGATSYSWNLQSGWTGTSSTNTISITPSGSGTISVSASNTCVISAPVTLSVTILPIPTVTATVSGTIDCNNSSVTLIGSGASTYTWSGPAITSGTYNAFAFTNAAGIYSLTGTTTGCVSNTATVTVITNTIVPSLSVTTTSSILCANNSVTLTASGANTYTWAPGGGTTASVTYTPSSTFNYTVLGTNTSNGCIGTFVFTQSVSTCAGINNFVNNTSGIFIFPNPTNGLLNVHFNSISENTLIELYDQTGKLVLREKITCIRYEINLNDLSSGVYQLLISENRIHIRKEKIIKQ